MIAGDRAPWPLLFIGGRVAATAIGAVLTIWEGPHVVDAVGLVYAVGSSALLGLSDRARREPALWLADFVVLSAFVLLSRDWRSPFYLLWLSSLVLPAVQLPLRQALAVACAAPVIYFAIAFFGGPTPGHLHPVTSETLAIHLSLPFLVTCALAYAADALQRLQVERAARERLAIETERRRIAWELHDSAKQRLHAAHLLVSSLDGRVPEELERVVGRAVVELESAASDMDTSLAELRSPLQGRPLAEALRARARELDGAGGARIVVEGDAPALPVLVGAHVYRIACEAITNALRHADPSLVTVTLGVEDGGLLVAVEDDGRGLAPGAVSAGTGARAMDSRAATIGGRLRLAPAPGGRGTRLTLHVPLTRKGKAKT